MRVFRLILLSCTLTHATEPLAFEFRDASETFLGSALDGMMGHAGAVGDVNDDGFPDFFVGGYCDRPNERYAPANGPVPNVILVNVDGRRGVPYVKTDVRQCGRASFASFADLDSDGDLDLIVSNNARPDAIQPRMGYVQSNARLLISQIFKNESGNFIPVVPDPFPKETKATRNIGALDYDGDGLLDLLVLEDSFGPSSRSVLLKNIGGFRFKNVTEDVGLPENLNGLGLAISDLNEDGIPDFFVAHSNRLFVSNSANMSYEENYELNTTFAWRAIHKDDLSSGAAFGDLNSDGRMDLVVGAHFNPASNRIFINTTTAQRVSFLEITNHSTLARSFPVKTPHVELRDFDNDSKLDIYLSAVIDDLDGKVRPIILKNLGSNENGYPIFSRPDVSSDSESRLEYFAAGPSVDIDRDGGLDLLLPNWFRDGKSRVLLNTSDRGNWLSIEIRDGTSRNRFSIGAKVRVLGECNDSSTERPHLGYAENYPGTGFSSGHEPNVHFGLASAEKVGVEIFMPHNGGVFSIDNVPANQHLVLHVSELANERLLSSCSNSMR